MVDKFSGLSPAAKAATGAVSALAVGFKAIHKLGVTALKEVTDVLKNIGSVALNVGKQIWDSLSEIGEIPTSIGDIISEYASYNATMKEVQAISGATSEEFQQLLDITAKLGRETQFTATNAAEGLKYMSMAGWSAQESIAGLPSVLRLAQIGSADLGTTSDIVTDTITAMGMAATDCGDMVDMFAATITRSNTNVEMMGETMKYVSPVAGSLGVQFEDLALATGLLANVGIKASLAGTSLRTLLTNMAGPTKTVAGAMQEYGISLQETADGSVDLDATMVNLRESLGNVPLKEQAAAAKALFGKTGMAGGLAIINASQKDYDNLKYSIENSTESMTYWRKECKELGLSSKETEKRVNHLHDVFQESKDMADALNISSTDLTKSISLLGKDGKVTSDDIESLFTVFNKLNNASEEQESIMKKYGIQIEKNDDNSLNYDKSLKNIVSSLRDKTKKEREAILTELDLADSIDQVNELCSLSPKEFNKTIEAIENTQSAAEKAQKIIDESLKGSVMRLGSAISGLGLSIMSKCAPALSDFCDLLGDSVNLFVNGDIEGAVTKFSDGMVKGISNIPKLMTQAFKSIESFVVNQGPSLLSIGSSFISNVCKGIVNNQDSIETTLSSAIGQAAQFVKDNMPDIGEAGRAIISSLSQAFDDNKDDIGEALKTATEEAVSLYIEGKTFEAKVKISLIPDFIEGVGAGLWKGMGGPGDNPLSHLGFSGKTSLKNMGNNSVGFWDSALGKGLSQAGNWIKDKLFPPSYAAEIEKEGTETGKKYGKNLADGAKETSSNSAKEIGKGISDKLESMDPSELKGLQTQLKSVQTTISSVASSASKSFEGLRNSLRTSFVGSANIVRNQMVSINNVVRNQSLNARNAFTTQFISMRKVATTQATATRNVVTTQMISMKNVVTTQSRAARNSFTSQMISMRKVASTQSKLIGQEIANGLTTGLQNGSQSAVNAARDMVNKVNAEMKKTAKINSPSKITTGYGENLDEGFIVGMKNRAEKMYSTARDTVKNMSNAMKTAVQGEMVQFAINTSSNNESRIVNNINNNFKLSDEDIEKLADANAQRPVYTETKVGETTFVKGIAKPLDKYNKQQTKRLNRLEGVTNV